MLWNAALVYLYKILPASDWYFKSRDQIHGADQWILLELKYFRIDLEMIWLILVKVLSTKSLQFCFPTITSISLNS